MENESLLKNRLTELALRAWDRGTWVFSEFLTLAEQDTLLRLRLDCPFTLFGGLPAAERKIACFGSEELCGTAPTPPVTCLKIAPLRQKFADPLTHRDFLGSLMALGIRREVLGDIEVVDNTGYLFCLDSISGYLCDTLTAVRRTAVSCVPSEPPETLSAPPLVSEFVVASERLDAAVAAVFRLSRSEAQKLIASEQVFLSGRLALSPSAVLSEGDIVSVRRHGRFLYEGVLRETKKGRLRIRVRIPGSIPKIV